MCFYQSSQFRSGTPSGTGNTTEMYLLMFRSVLGSTNRIYCVSSRKNHSRLVYVLHRSNFLSLNLFQFLICGYSNFLDLNVSRLVVSFIMSVV